MLLRVLFLVTALFSFIPIAYADDYAKPSWDNLIRTLVRFRAVDIGDQQMLNEFAIVTECDLYKAFYHNDFKWNEVLQAVKSSAAANIATFPTGYSYDVPMHLDRYDFAGKLFRFDAKSVLNNINAFRLYHANENECGASDARLLPENFRAVLSAPVYMDGLPLSEKDAEALLSRMDAEGNTSREIYARFNFRITYIEPLRKQIDQTGGGEVARYSQSSKGGDDAVRLDTRLESLAFYEDKERTNLIYQYQP